MTQYLGVWRLVLSVDKSLKAAERALERWRETRRNEAFYACLQRDAEERLARMRAFTRRMTEL